ncbi:hypothetical protein OSB04_028052 [Centaurea solstitialis]|uniref:Uncharacterized protein n=1 Tax=Centaurea solstitialis TaxID=347529 RepID=A0AA38ST96_9ASTR|nr:hypothetical protein OSB04_028052 [Centaurea solstitialis]
MNLSKVVLAYGSISCGVSRPFNVKSPRAFVTASRHLKKEVSEEKIDKTCDKVTKAADAVKQGATQVTHMSKDVRGKVCEATENIEQKTKDDIVDIAGKKLKQKVVDKK